MMELRKTLVACVACMLLGSVSQAAPNICKSAGDEANAMEENKVVATNALHVTAYSDLIPGETQPSAKVLELEKGGVDAILAQTEYDAVRTQLAYWKESVKEQLDAERTVYKWVVAAEVDALAGETYSSAIEAILNDVHTRIEGALTRYTVYEAYQKAANAISREQLQEFKTAAQAEIIQAAGEQPWTEAMCTAVDSATNAVVVAENMSAAEVAKATWMETVGDLYQSELAGAKDAAVEDIVAAAGERPWTDAMSAVVKDAISTVVATTNKLDAESAKDTGTRDVGDLYQSELAGAKDAAIAEIIQAAGEQPWSEAMCTSVENATNAVIAAANKTSTESAKGAGTQNVGAVYQSEFAGAKDGAVAEIIQAAGEQPWSEALRTAVENATNAVAAAANKTGVESAKGTGTQNVGNLYRSELAGAKDAAIAAIIQAAGEQPWTGAMRTAVENATNAVVAAANKTGVESAKGTGTQNVGNLYRSELAGAKDAAIAAIIQAAGEQPWTGAMRTAVENATNAVAAAANKSAAESAKGAGTQNVGNLYRSELAGAKDAAIAAIIQAAGEQPWTDAMRRVVENATNTVVAAGTKSVAATAYGAGTQAVGAQYQTDVAEAKAAAIAAINQAAGEQPLTSEMRAAVDAALRAVEAATDRSGVATAKETGLQTINTSYASELETDREAAIVRVTTSAGALPWAEKVREVVEAGTNEILVVTTKTEIENVVIETEKAIEAIVKSEDFVIEQYLYPEGDGAFVLPTKAVTYTGVYLDGNGSVIGTMTGSLSKPNRKSGLSTMTVKVKLLSKSTLLFKSKIELVNGVGGPYVLKAANRTTSAFGDLTIQFSGDSLTGIMADGCRVDAVCDVFKMKNAEKIARILPFVGNWTVALRADGMACGTLTVSISKAGRVKIKGRVDGETSSTYSGIIEVGDTWVGAPVLMYKANRSTIRSCAMRIAFVEQSGVPVVNLVNNTGLLQSRAKSDKTQDVLPLRLVAGGRPTLKKKSDVFSRVSVVGREEQPQTRKITFRPMTGEVTGSIKWKSLSAQGRIYTETAKIYGVDVNGVIYGSAVIRNTSEVLSLKTLE